MEFERRLAASPSCRFYELEALGAIRTYAQGGMGKSENITQSYTLYLIRSAFDPTLYALCPAP